MSSLTFSGAARSTPRALVRPSFRQHPDLRWLVPVSLAGALLCAAPYVVASLLGPPELERDGTFWFVQDFSQYEAAMREGARTSSWLVHDHFSAEPHAAVLMYSLYVGLGKLAAVLAASPLVLLGVLEWLGRLAVLLSVYAFAAAFVSRPRQRCLAVLLTLGTLGLGAWLLPVRIGLQALGADDLAALLPTTINPYLEINSFGVLLAAPHLMLALAFTLGSVPLYLRAAAHQQRLELMPTPRRRAFPVWHLLLAADVVALCLVHPFNMPALLGVLTLHALLIRRTSALSAAVAAAFAAAPLLLYDLLVFGTDPFWSSTYAAQNLMPSPAPWILPIEFGLVMLAAPLAWPVVRTWPIERRYLLVLWVGLHVALMYMPVPYQRRLAIGVQPALAVLAAIGIVHLNRRLVRRGVHSAHRRLVNYGLALLAMATSTLVYVALLASAATNRPAEVYLWTRAEAGAADWLAAHSTPEDVVLSSMHFGNPLGGTIDGRVVVGHVVATRDLARKLDLVTRFYAPQTSSADRARILSETGATMVALGPSENVTLGASEQLSAEPYLQLVYASEAVRLFRVRR